MTTFAPVCLAAVQATPVILDREASVEKALDLCRDAAAQGAKLVVLPECFLSFYPSGMRSLDHVGTRAWPTSSSGCG